MIEIYEFNHSAGGLRIEYSDNTDVFRITTDDTPRSELYEAEQNILRFALRYFGISGIACSFRSIKWSSGSKPGTRIELTVSTAVLEYARMILPKTDNDVVVDSKTSEPIDCNKNWYLGHLEMFEKEIKGFIEGKKAQFLLPFDTSEPGEEEEADLGKVANA